MADRVVVHYFNRNFRIVPKKITVQINPVYFNNETVVVKGLTDGSKLISKPVPGAYKGMKVEIRKKND